MPKNVTVKKLLRLLVINSVDHVSQVQRYI